MSLAGRRQQGTELSEEPSLEKDLRSKNMSRAGAEAKALEGVPTTATACPPARCQLPTVRPSLSSKSWTHEPPTDTLLINNKTIILVIIPTPYAMITKFVTTP